MPIPADEAVVDTDPGTGGRRLPSIAGDGGMTLVELMVAITILLIVMAGIAAGATTGLQLSRGNSNRIVAANIADEQIGQVRTLDYASIPQSPVTLPDVTRGAVTYTVAQTAATVYLDAEGSCDAPAGAFNANRLSYLRVVVEVSWPRMDGIDPVRTETIIEPPVTAYDPYSGHLAINVTDRDGAAQEGITVRLVHDSTSSTPATSRFDVTDEAGCVFFANLKVEPGTTVGNYHVRLNEDGYVDRASGLSNTQNQSPESIVNVVSAQLRKIEFAYDRASRLDTTLVGRFGGTAFDALPLTIANDNYNGGNGPVTFASTGALAATALHPFPSGFGLWAGRCGDADPGSDDRTRLATDPGVTTTGDVAMGTLFVTVFDQYRDRGRYRYRRRPDAVLRATDECGNDYEASAAPTDSNGQTTVALPYGTWTISVSGHSAGAGWPWWQITLSPSDTGAQVTYAVTR